MRLAEAAPSRAGTARFARVPAMPSSRAVASVSPVLFRWQNYSKSLRRALSSCRHAPQAAAGRKDRVGDVVSIESHPRARSMAPSRIFLARQAHASVGLSNQVVRSGRRWQAKKVRLEGADRAQGLATMRPTSVSPTFLSVAALLRRLAVIASSVLPGQCARATSGAGARASKLRLEAAERALGLATVRTASPTRRLLPVAACSAVATVMVAPFYCCTLLLLSVA